MKSSPLQQSCVFVKFYEIGYKLYWSGVKRTLPQHISTVLTQCRETQHQNPYTYRPMSRCHFRLRSQQWTDRNNLCPIRLNNFRQLSLKNSCSASTKSHVGNRESVLRGGRKDSKEDLACVHIFHLSVTERINRNCDSV